MALGDYVPVEGAVEVVVNQEYLGQKVQNHFHVWKDAPWALADLQALGTIVQNAWNAHIGPLQSNENQYRSVKLKDLTSEEALGTEMAFGVASGGDRLGGGMPGNVALAVRLVTGFSGRHRRGRMFLAAFTEDQFVGNQLTDVAALQVRNNMESWMDDINAGDGQLAVVSKYSGKQLQLQPNGETIYKPLPREAGLVSVVTGFIVDPFGDSQRRRLEGRGN